MSWMKWTAARALAVACLAGFALPQAPAHADGEPSIAAWTTAGAESGAGSAQLITVTPASSPASIIHQLRARPAGSRGLLLVGFANDITTRETIRRRRAFTTAAVPSPWVDKGVAAVRARINGLMVRLMRAGVQIDLVVVQCDASLRATQYDQYGAPGWRSIQSDSRFTALKAVLGSTDLPAEMAQYGAVRGAWDNYFDASLDNALHKAIVTTARRYFPGLPVVAQNRYTLPADSQVMSARAGGGFGSHDQPRFYLEGSELSAFEALGGVVADMRAIRAASGRAVMPAIATPSWGGSSGTPAFTGSHYWNELVYHLLLAGSPSILMDRGVPSSEELASLGAIIAAVQDRSGGATIAPFAHTAAVDGDVAVASAFQSGSTIHWRLTGAPGVETLRVTFADESTEDVAIDPEVGGAWYSHSSSQTIAFIQQPDAPPPPPDGPEYMVLFDAPPAVGFVQPVEHAQQYLIVYQGAGDPNAGATGLVNPVPVIAEINRQIGLGMTSEWGVLDFEDPFDDILMTGPDHPSYSATLASLVETIQAVKAEFPDIKWTYYGWPRIGYYPGGRDWGWWSQEQREVYYTQYTSLFAPLMNEMEWFMPGVYDKYERSAGLPNAYSGQIVAESSFRTANVVAIQRHFEALDAEVPPILPAVSPWFQEASVAAYLKPIPLDEYCEDQLIPLFEAGADGVSIWGAMDHFIELATWQALPPGYEEQTEMVRTRFALDYFGGMSVGMIDWYSPAVLTTLGDSINATMQTALEAAAAGGVLAP